MSRPKKKISTSKRNGGEVTRSRILQAALQAFAATSVRLTTMEEVARISGLSRQTVYRHFPSKEDLLAAASLFKSKQITVAVQKVAGRTASSRDQIIAAIMISIKSLVSDPQLRELVDTDYKELMLRAARPEIVQVTTERWLPILQRGIADGTLRPDLDCPMAVSWLTDVLLLFAMRIIVFGESLTRIRDEIERFVLEGLWRR